MTRDTERWRSVPDAHDYLISDEGNLRRMLADGTWRAMKPALNRRAHGDDGYLKVCLGRSRQEYVHKLVALAFLGVCPDDMNVDHRDHNRLNNSLTNLRYLPLGENHYMTPAQQDAWDRDAGREDVA